MFSQTTTRKCLSPATLSNQGVMLLEAGRYAEGSQVFRRATKMLWSEISCHNNKGKGYSAPEQAAAPSQQESHISIKRRSEATRSHQATFAADVREVGSGIYTTDDLSSSIASALSHSSISSRSQPTASKPDGEECPPSKRRRTTQDSSMDTSPFAVAIATIPDERHSTARPIWLASRYEQRTPMESAFLSAAIVYNLGLSCHLRAAARHMQGKFNKELTITTSNLRMAAALQEHAEESLLLYNRALQFYKMSSDVMLRKSMSTMRFQSPVLIVIFHNMMLAHAAVGENESAAKCQSQLAHQLRLVDNKREKEWGDKKRDYEGCLMRLLLLPKANTKACAA